MYYSSNRGKKQVKNKKEPKEKIEIDFNKVFEEIREPEEIKMKNIFDMLGWKPSEPEKVHAEGYDRSKYYDYLRWLRNQGKSEWDFR